MPENIMGEYLHASLDGIKSIAGMDTVIGNPITTPSGVTVIPVSKITMGFASGGLDYGVKKITGQQNSGGGGGTGISITPLAFLSVGKDADIRLIPITQSNTSLDRIANLIEDAPDIIEKIKGALK